MKQDNKPKPGAYKDPQNGIRTTHWFWGAADTFKTKPNGDSNSGQTSGEDPSDEADAEVRQMLLDSPNANAATLYNMIKAKGLKVVKGSGSEAKKKTSEADSASANTQMLPADAKGIPKKKPKTESSKGALSWTAKFRESSAVDDGIGHTKFEVALITEGMGNFKDGFYYDRKALETAIPIFEGTKIYADHPSKSEEEDRPERSVKDILGHYQNLRIQETEDGRAQLIADLVTLPDKDCEWARTRIKHAVEYAKQFPDKEFIGLSINASGDAMEESIDEVLKRAPEGAKIKLQEAKDSGIETIRVVSEIKDAVSCDLVTEAGAGGKIINLIEGENMGKKIIKTKNREADPATDGDGEKHDDASQDMELIKKMLDEYVGAADHGQETLTMANEAYEAYKEMGHKEGEAMKMAGAAMKLAKHMAAKKEAGAKQTDEADEADESDEADKTQECGDEEKDDKMKKMESELLRVKGRLAIVEAQRKQSDVDKYVETKLAESKQARSITKAFREAAGKIKSNEDFDTKWKLFCEGQKGQGEALGFVFTEKQTTTEGDDSGNGSLDFSGCAENY